MRPEISQSGKTSITHLKVRLLIAVLVIFSVIVTDQLTKYAARQVLFPGDHHSFLGGFVQLILVENHGGFLGVLNQLGEPLRFGLLTIGVGGLLIYGLFLLLFRTRERSSLILLSLIIGGGMGNLLDRLINSGGVTDFVLLQVWRLQTGIFNLADVYILAGSCLLGYFYFSRTDH